MAGCVSAMNREGLAIFVNGAPSELPSDAAAPTCIVARDVVQHARTIAEATEIIRRYRVFVSAMFLVASRRDGRAAAIGFSKRCWSRSYWRRSWSASAGPISFTRAPRAAR